MKEENLTRLCNECLTIAEVAEKLNTSRPTVRKYLEKDADIGIAE